MTRPRPETLESERDKLYLTDAELIRRLGVPAREARATIQQLESKAGFPRKQALWGNRRYWPAVEAWLNSAEGMRFNPAPADPPPFHYPPRPAVHLPEVKNCVYFIACDDHIKIGVTISGQAERRLKTLESGNHRELKLLAVIEDAPGDLEYSLHRRFAKDRTRGEWFKASPELLAYIETVKP